MASETKIELFGRSFAIAPGILVEPASEGRVVLWLPGGREGGFQAWERIASIAGTAADLDGGLLSVPVVSIAVRQALGLSLGKLARKLMNRGADRGWTLPNGESGEQVGAKRTDRRLVWAEAAGAPLDEAGIRAYWAQSRGCQEICKGLFLISGIEFARPQGEVAAPGAGPGTGPAGELPPAETPHDIAERALKAAQARGDARQIVMALSDLGLAHIYAGDARLASQVLERALGEARRIGDRALEVDVLGNLTQATHTLGDLARAYELILPVLDYTRQAGDRYGEKLAHDRLGQVLLALGDREEGLAHLEQAWSIASELKDMKHEADLLWRAGIEHAELGNRDQAVGYASAAIGRLRWLGNPSADWYAHHLANYQANPAAESSFLPSMSSGGFSSRPSYEGGPAATEPVAGPGLLRMAISAARAMVTFVGSGFKTSTAELYHERLASCGTCEFHTGVRCRVCGCITAAKARLLHERCPANRWTA